MKAKTRESRWDEKWVVFIFLKYLRQEFKSSDYYITRMGKNLHCLPPDRMQ